MESRPLGIPVHRVEVWDRIRAGARPDGSPQLVRHPIQKAVVSRDVRRVGPVPEIEKLNRKTERNLTMLWTIVVVLLVLWLLGMLTSYALGGLIHILLVVALVVVIISLFQGRKFST